MLFSSLKYCIPLASNDLEYDSQKYFSLEFDSQFFGYKAKFTVARISTFTINSLIKAEDYS